MPKPKVWAEDIDEILSALSEEQAQLLQLAEEQHALFSRSVHLAFNRVERLDLLSRGGFGRRGGGLCGAGPGGPLDLCTTEANEDVVQEVFQEVPDNADMLFAEDHEHDSAARKTSSHASITASRSKSKKSDHSKATAEDLLGLDHFRDRSKAWTDLLAGMLVLINSFVMLAPGLASLSLNPCSRGES